MTGSLFLIISIALLIAIPPAMFWLWLWLKVDKNPEPWKYILSTFVAGMISAPLVLPIQIAFFEYYDLLDIQIDVLSPIMLLVTFHLILAGTEEIFKYGAAYFSALSTSVNDERMDPIVYLIIAALGFAAMENILYVMGPLTDSTLTLRAQIEVGLGVGLMRFIGPTLLHVIASASLGLFLYLSYYQPLRSKRVYLIPLGLLTATLIHMIFNLSLMAGESAGLGGYTIAIIMVSTMVTLALALTVLLENLKKRPG